MGGDESMDDETARIKHRRDTQPNQQPLHRALAAKKDRPLTRHSGERGKMAGVRVAEGSAVDEVVVWGGVGRLALAPVQRTKAGSAAASSSGYLPTGKRWGKRGSAWE